MEASAIKAAIYVRISDDREGEGLGVRRQEMECRQLAERLGWIVVEVYRDNDVSAKDRKKQRKDYHRMLADIRAERINAVIAWAPDRLHRQMRELVPFIDLVSKHGIAIQTVVGGQIDLTTAIGRMNAKTLGNIAEFESDLKRERILSKIDELVRDGKVHNGGARPFGYTRIYDGSGPRRKIVRDELNEAEAELIREARDRVLAGESLYSICKDWQRRGLKTSTGKAWSHQAMRLMLISGRIAGLKEHRRQVVGEASWPAIVSVDDREALRARLLKPHPLSGRAKGRRHWLSGHVVCECGTAMRVSSRHDNGRFLYRCPPEADGACGGCSVSYPDLEQLIRETVIERLSDRELLRDLAARENTTQAEAAEMVAAIEADDRRLRAQRDQLADCDPDELLDLRQAIRKVRARIAINRDKLASLTGAYPLVGVDVEDLAERWDDLEVSQRGALLRVAGVDRVVIRKTSVRGRFDPGRVELVPVGD
jgi:DNA invertase Pin-like site-specific DNA recombinase